MNSKYGGNFDLRPAFDDKYGVFKAEIPAIFMKNVQNVSVKDFELTSTDELMDFHTQAIHAESFGKIRIEGFKGASLRKEDSEPVFRFKDGKKVHLANCAVPSNQILYAMENVAGKVMVD